MVFEQHFLILGSSIMNVFLIKIFVLGLFMVNESQNAWGRFFGCIITAVSSGLQSFALANLLSPFIK